MSLDQQHQPTVHTQLVVKEQVEEVVTFSGDSLVQVEQEQELAPKPGPEPESAPPTVAILSVLPTPGSAPAAKPSRLAAAFQKISNGCGLCIHPFRNSGPTDYHALVHTPTDDAPETFHDNVHDAVLSGHEPKSIDPKGDSHMASTSTIADDHTRDHFSHEGKAKVSEDIRERSLPQDPFAFVEEITVMSSKDENEGHEHNEQERVVETIVEKDVASPSVKQTSEVVNTVLVAATEVTADEIVTTSASIAVASSSSPSSSPVEETNATPLSPTPIRPNGAFTKFTKRPTSSASRANSVISATTTTTTTSSSSATTGPSNPSSPLLERLGRFAKIIKPSETSSTMQSKVDSLQISSAPSLTDTKVNSHDSITVITHEPVSLAQLTPQEENDKKGQQGSLEVKEEKTTTTTLRSASPPLPALPQQHSFDSKDSATATTMTTTTTTTTSIKTSQPVPIPGQTSQLIHPWSHSPTTLHNDVSSNNSISNSNQSLSRKGTGRASTIDSTLEGGGTSSEAGSVDSGSRNNLSQAKKKNNNKKTEEGGEGEGEGGMKQQRRKSVLKKLGKIINTMNTNRKNSGDSMTKAEKRMSRQASQTMVSPIEADEK
ncbi:hypothetical protein BG004_002736 [Podila humilis]|nr:hypothetical protein BG004_002736 [Podila humilis]